MYSEKEKYSKLFLNTSSSKNFGEVTFFIKGMMGFIKKGQKSIKEMLENKIEKLNFSRDYLDNLALSDSEKKIMFIYIQNNIFSEFPLKDKELSKILEISRAKLRIHIENLMKKGYLVEISKNPMIHVIDDELKEVLD